MGQQASSGRGGRGPGGERGRLAASLQRAEALIADPERLQRECDFHFRRAGLDAHGELRRVEMRRLLWTFAQGLGSTGLTWEAIEAAAVAGTLEPHVPVATRAEFFRCVLKTVHLVAAELRGKVAWADAQVQQRGAATALPVGSSAVSGSATPGDVRGERQGSGCGDSASSRSASAGLSSSAASPCSAASPEAPPSGKGIGKGSRLPASPSRTAAAEPQKEAPSVAPPQKEHPPVGLPLFQPAPGGSPEDAAPINGMTALILSNEGTFDPQRLLVSHGMLVLSDPGDAGPALGQRLAGGGGPSVLDLSLLECVASGEEVLQTAVVPMLGPALQDREALDRLLVLGFAGDDAVCLWFETPEDCELCRQAVLMQEASPQGVAGHEC